MAKLKERKIPYRRLQELIMSYGLSGLQLGQVLGYSAPTGKKKLDNPLLLTVKDLDALNRWGIPMDRIREALMK